MQKKETAEQFEPRDNTPQPGKKPRTMESSSGERSSGAEKANVLKDMNTYTEGAQVAKGAQAAENTGPSENFSRFMDVYRPEMKPNNNAAKRQDLLNTLMEESLKKVQKISDDVDRYHAQVAQHHRDWLKEARHPLDVDSFIQFYRPEMKPNNNAARRQDLLNTLMEESLKKVKKISDDVDGYHAQVAQHHRDRLEEELNKPLVDG